MVGFLKVGENLLCSKCGYQWKPRGERQPKSCPRCKRRVDYIKLDVKTL